MLLPSSAAALLATAAAVALLGCASATGPVGYPSEWPALATVTSVDGCPDISGTYANEPLAGFPAGREVGPRLTHVFAAMGRGPRLLNAAKTRTPWPVPDGAVSAMFQLGPQQLSVDFNDESNATSRLVFRRYRFDWAETRYDDLYTCYATGGAPRLRFFAEPESHSSSIPYLYLEAGGTLVFLLKASDGSLVVQWRSESLAIVLIAPSMKFDSVWWRYRPLGRAQ